MLNHMTLKNNLNNNKPFKPIALIQSTYITIYYISLAIY